MKMAEIKMPHLAHEEHLCFLENIGYIKSNLNDYKELVKDATFICKPCGRVAANEKIYVNLRNYEEDNKTPILVSMFMTHTTRFNRQIALYMTNE
jgi:hypothetical protein